MADTHAQQDALGGGTCFAHAGRRLWLRAAVGILRARNGFPQALFAHLEVPVAEL